MVDRIDIGEDATLYCGDCLDVLPTLEAGSVHCVVTSPPYLGLRDYGVDGQLGLEATPDEYVAKMVEVFRAVRRVLRDDGTVWLNLGDSYAASQYGSGGGWALEDPGDGKGVKGARSLLAKPIKLQHGLKPKDLIGIPWRVALALQADGWYLRQDIIWHKPNPMPESVTDRCTKAHEYVFLLTKKARYFYDADAVRESGPSYTRKAGGYYGRDGKNASRFPGKGGFGDSDVTTHGRNCRSVWTITTKPFAEAHFATFPPELAKTCILAGTSERGCCPNCGASFVRMVEKTREPTRPARDSKVLTSDGRLDSAVCGNRDPLRHVSTSTTLGWELGCKCNKRDPIPCTVLDPFSGAGTTAVVALKHGRKCIGIELNAGYNDIAARRIKAAIEDQGLFRQGDGDGLSTVR